MSSWMTPRWPLRDGQTLARAALLQFDLIAHGGDGLGVRPDAQYPASASASANAARSEESVARMRRRPSPCSRSMILATTKYPRAAGGGPMVGHLDMQRVAVGLGIDRDGLDAHAAGLMIRQAISPRVGNQNSLEHSGYETRVPVVWLNGVLAAVSMTAASRRPCRRGDRKPPLTACFYAMRPLAIGPQNFRPERQVSRGVTSARSCGRSGDPRWRFSRDRAARSIEAVGRAFRHPRQRFANAQSLRQASRE